MIAHGAKAPSTSAAGSRKTSLLRSDPSAIRPTMDSSRSAANPVT